MIVLTHFFVKMFLQQKYKKTRIQIKYKNTNKIEIRI